MPFDPQPLQVIHTPGHSTDHHAVWDAETRTLFSADLWLGVRVRAVAETENPCQHIESLTRAIALKPERMFDAHRGLVENPVKALEAKRAWLIATVTEVERQLDAGHSDAAILKNLLEGEELLGYLSQGEYARRNFVQTVRRGRTGA